MMRVATTMLLGCLVVAAPLVFANDSDTSRGAPSSDASSAKPQTAPSEHEKDSNGAVSADREQGLDRARDRMSEEGRENTNAPNSPNRTTGHDRANERHKQHDARDKPDNN